MAHGDLVTTLTPHPLHGFARVLCGTGGPHSMTSPFQAPVPAGTRADRFGQVRQAGARPRAPAASKSAVHVLF